MHSAVFFYISACQLFAPAIRSGTSGLNYVSVLNYSRQTCHGASLKASAYQLRRNCAMEQSQGLSYDTQPFLTLFSLLVLCIFSLRLSLQPPSFFLFLSLCIFSPFFSLRFILVMNLLTIPQLVSHTRSRPRSAPIVS